MTRRALSDRPERWPVARSRVQLDGSFIAVRRDTVEGPDGSRFDRDVVRHDDAVGVVALDEDGRVLLLGQYRHAVGHRLLELPAGLLDVPGESPLETAVRELAEEAHLRAADWRVLLDAFSSPGFSTEAWRVYLARGLTDVPEGDRHERVHEEADMTEQWVPLPEAVHAVFEGRITDGMAVMALLATWAARAGSGYAALRSVDAPWSRGPTWA
jgi:8-oxo-dGDP phosphatase